MPAVLQLASLEVRDFMWGQLHLQGATSLASISMLGECACCKRGRAQRGARGGGVCVCVMGGGVEGGSAAGVAGPGVAAK